MGEKIRIGGFDTNAATRQETITDKKKVKGYNSQTYLRGNEPKQKLQISLEEGFETLEQLEDMLSNPKFQTTKILGVKENEKVIVHNNNFKHGKGVLNHIAADTVEVKEFGVKSDVHYISKEDAWQTVIDEDFNSVNFPSSIGNGITSTGLANQERALTYRDISNTATSMSNNYANYGDQTLAMGNLNGFMIDDTAMYDNLDMEFTCTHTASSGYINFYISRRGYNYSNNVGLYFRIRIDTDQIFMNDQFSGRNHEYFDANINLVNNVSYTVRLVKIGRFVTAYLNGVKMAEFELLRNIYGNIGMYSNFSTLHLDKLTVKTLPSKMLAFPDDSFVASESKTYETPHGKINKTFDYDLQGFEHGVPTDAKVHFDFREGKGKTLNDKNRDVDNKNDGNIRKGKWVDGYFYDAVQLTDGDILIKDSSTIKDLSEFNLHTRFKLNNLENTYRSLQANPIISRQHEFTVYDYKKPDTLVGWWKLDGDYVDSSGYENHGTSATNTSVVDGKQFTNAINFNGSASVQLGDIYNPVDYERPQATFSAWVKLNADVTGYHPIFEKWLAGTSTKSYGFWLNENGGKQRLHLATQINSTYYSAFSSDFDFTTNEWAHFALTWDKERVTFYLNGERLNTDNMGITDFTNDFDGHEQNMIMGSGTNAVIQDVRIYNSVMTNDEIKRIYNGGDGLRTKLNRHHLAFEIYGEMLIGDVIEEGEWVEAWFQSDGKSSFIFRRVGQEVVGEARKLLGDVVLYVPFDDDINDKSVYKATGTNSGSGSSNGADKRFYKARSFDGVNDYVSFADQDRYSFVRNAFAISFWVKPDTLSGSLFGKGASGNFEYAARWNSSRLTFNAWNTAGSGVYNTIYSYEVDAGYWHHFVITADGTSMYMYQNGELVTSIAKSGNNMGNGNQPITIGRATDGAGTFYMDGKLDEMKFYNRAISKEEIMFLFSAGQYTSDMHIGSSKGYMPNGQRESGLITHAKFDGFAADETDHRVFFEQNNGTFVDGKIGQAFRTSIDNSYLEFIAMNDQRPIQWGMDRRTRRSYAFWIKPDGTDMDGFIISKPFNGSGAYNFQVRYASSALTVLLWNYASNGIQTFFTASNLLDADVWQHIAITFDQTEIKVYKNGEFVDRGDYLIGEYSAPSGGNLYFTHNFATLYDYGSTTSPSGKEHHAFSADYDDLRIYNYDLDKYEIQKIYNKGNGTSLRGLNTLTMDLFSLQDKFYFPHRHVDGLSQVRVWDLGYDSINNPMKKSKVFDTHNEEGTGLYTKVSNRYFPSLYSAMLQEDSAQTSQWTTDTPSKFNKYALDVSNQDDWILDNDHTMNRHFNDERIYEITFSVWVKKEETTNDLFLFYTTTSSTTPTVIALNYSGKGRLYIKFGDGSSSYTIHTEDIFIHPDHKWFKFDATFSYGVWKFYVDGELVVRHDASWYWFTFQPSTKMRHDGYNPDYLVANTQLHDVALTEQEIKERFIYDPVNPYFNSKQIFSKNYEQNSKNAIFVENGLFGMLIHKALPQEAKRTVGGVDFYRWDNGWKSVGRLMTEKSD